MALLHKPTTLLSVWLEWMTGRTVQKQQQEQTKPCVRNRFLQKNKNKCPFDLVFPCGNRLVLSGSPLQSSMALARGSRGSRKGLYRPLPPRVCDKTASSSSSVVVWAPSLHLWTRVSREHRQSCNTLKKTLNTSTDTWDTSDVGITVFTEDTDFDRMHLIIWVLQADPRPPGGVHMFRWKSVQEFRAGRGRTQRVGIKLFKKLWRPRELISLRVVFTWFLSRRGE